ncbi:UDP pyrophosphate synthase [Rhodomicrobium udaipurense JA643]|uniref:Isoprenyl transferase n=2 Tax=Rhodomicrobium udaipurense TaxID=1202716 RepID=A0A8I1GE17_9HYPH|nr:UDP pyrophosphate synthase [Rhodomicrobium udaipurense JA643]MBJ7544230.1 isoprenyl transferase [Rhodomicrobium udaipurense]
MREQALADGNERPCPKHIAIIMDGNGRWAAQRGLPRSEGHRRGVESTRECVRAAAELGISYLTLFSFSSENWKRPPLEVTYLMGLLRRFIRRDLAEIHQNNIKVRVIGSEEGVPPDLFSMFRDAMALTSGNTGMELIIAFNYGARDEIVRAAKRLAEQAKAGEIDPADITQEMFAKQFDTAGIPDPDLLIRTSGEQRISNFLLWQCAYSEFLFVDNFWPDFTRQTLESAIASYQQRERRFGGLAG